MLQRSDVAIDPVLGNVSVAYKNDSYIADVIFPVVTVSKQTGIYFIYDKSGFAAAQTKRAAGSPSNEVEYGLTQARFSTVDHALKEFVTDEVQDQAMGNMNPLVDATENATEKIMVGKEIDAATVMKDTTQVPTGVTLTGTAQWNDYVNSTPISDVRTARQAVKAAIFRAPNTLLVGQQVYDVLIDHPTIVDRIKYSQLGVASADLLARVFNVEKVLVGAAGQNSATEGEVDALSYIWGKNAWLLYIAPTLGLKQITFGFTFMYGAPSVKRWRDEDREGTYVRVGGYNYQQVVVAAGAAYFIKNAIA